MSGGFRKRSEATEQEHVVSWCSHREGMYPFKIWIHSLTMRTPFIIARMAEAGRKKKRHD